MATTYLAPDPIQSMQFIPGGIVPANGGQLFFYTAGSSTKTTVYKDNAAVTAWSNPIVLDSGGNLPSGGEVWFQSGITYKVVFAPSNDTDPPASPYWTKDNLSGMNDVGSQLTALEWVTGPVPTFVSATSFTVAGDATATFVAGRRVKSTNTGGTIYSTVTSVSFSAGVTTVNVGNDSGSLDSGLSVVYYGLFNPASPSISPEIIYRKATAIAAAATTNIWGVPGDYLHITGTNVIHSFSSASYSGDERTLIFDSTVPLNSNANISIPFGNVTTATNDRLTVRAETVSTAIITQYTRATGFPLGIAASASSSQVFAGPSSGSAATPVFRALVGAESAQVLLSVTSVVSTATVDFVLTPFTSSYDEFMISMLNVAPTNNTVSLNARVSVNGGSSYDAGSNYDYNDIRISGASVTGSTATATGIVLIIDMGSAANKAYNGDMKIFTPANSGNFKRINYIGSGDSTGGTEGLMSFGRWISTVAYDALRLFPSAGSISSGTFYLYGMRKS